MKTVLLISIFLISQNIFSANLTLDKEIIFTLEKLPGDTLIDDDLAVKRLSKTRLLFRGPTRRVIPGNYRSKAITESYLLNNEGKLLQSFAMKASNALKSDGTKILLAQKDNLSFYNMNGELIKQLSDATTSHCPADTTLLPNGYTIGISEVEGNGIVSSKLNIISAELKVVASLNLNNKYKISSNDRYAEDCKATLKVVQLNANSFALYIESGSKSSIVYKISFTGKILSEHKLEGRSPFRRKVTSFMVAGENIIVHFNNGVDDPSLLNPSVSTIRTIYPDGRSKDVEITKRLGSENDDFTEILQTSRNGVTASNSDVGDPELFFINAEGKLVKKIDIWDYVDVIYENTENNIVVRNYNAVEIYSHNGNLITKRENETIFGRLHLFVTGITSLGSGMLLYCSEKESENTYSYTLVDDSNLEILAENNSFDLEDDSMRHFCKRNWTQMKNKFLTVESTDNSYNLVLVDFIY